MGPVEPTRLPMAGPSPPHLYLGRSTSRRGMADVVSVRDLTKSYGDLRAVDGISFSVGKGEVFGIVGPNGAGKTTTWEILEGLRHADKGEVRVAGLDLRKDRRKLRELIGVQLQATALFERLTSRETLEVFGAMYARSLPADELLTLVNLEEGRVTLYTRKLETTLTAVFEYARTHALPVEDFRVRNASLEDVFLQMTGRRIRE